jgi:hypothetical protein
MQLVNKRFLPNSGWSLKTNLVFNTNDMKQLILFFMLCPLAGFSQAVFLKQPPKSSQCMTHAQRTDFDAKIKMKKAAYLQKHPERFSQTAKVQKVLFAWPMRASSEYDFMYNYFNMENFVDQDPDIDTDGDDDNREDWSIEDYQCNNRTYDEHRGQDINLWPFWWKMMDNNYVMAIAAAPGVILSKDDGHFDKNCDCVEPPNIISILHDDGTVSSYWHLKKNTITSKDTGKRVETGEFLGFIGSSGCSSWPHLHFEVHDDDDDRIEPFFGSCNVMNTSSWWQNQRGYWEPQIARLMTHSGIPATEKCPSDEEVRAKNQFASSEVVFTGIAFMDCQNGDQASCSLIRPSGTVQQTWTVNINSTDSRRYVTFPVFLPSGNSGTWTFKVVYRSRTYVHFFTVGCTANATVSGTTSDNEGYITGDFVSSTVVHNAASNKVLYQAANYIEFKPGAEIKSGVHLKARIKPCTYVE